MFSPKQSSRFSLLFLFLILCLIAFSVKLVLIQVFRSEYLANLAERQHNYFIELEPIRGTIFDRQLRPLAINVAVYSLFAKPKVMTAAQKQEVVKQLSSILGKDPSFLQELLSKKKYFVWLARKLPIETTAKIKALKLAGLDFIKESKRYYPNASLAAHIIGFADIDNKGLEGLERTNDKYLKGEMGWSQILRDAKQRELLIEKSYVAPRNGFDLTLTIDETIQYIAERALNRGMEQHHAKSATIIVMDPRTGEILALANRPTYDLSQVAESSIESRTNRALAYVYEPGSVFKIVTASAALEEKVFTETDKFFCENGSFRVGNHTLHDHHSHGTLTFSEVFEESSNIGVTKIAMKLGADKVYEYADRFRFGKLTGINLAGEVRGMLKTPSVWSKTSIGAIPIGQEVTVTPMQLVCAISAIANDGVYMKPYVVKYVKDQSGEIIKENHPETVAQVITPETANRVKMILNRAVENGTGKLAMIEGVKVAGKTGTAQKVIDGTYSHGKYFASFIGFAPLENPKLAVVVVFEEPKGTYFGGTVSAPVFKEVVENTLKYLEIKS